MQLLALTAAQPEQPWTSLVVGRRKDEAVGFRIGPTRLTAVRNLERLATCTCEDVHALPMPANTSEACT